MSITITWHIDALDCVPDVDGMVDYVVCAHWRCNATDGTFSGSVYNTTSYAVKSDNPDFTPYADLTEAQVVGWVQDSLTPEGVQATEDSIAQQIQNQVNPPIVSPKLPWAPVNP